MIKFEYKFPFQRYFLSIFSWNLYLSLSPSSAFKQYFDCTHSRLHMRLDLNDESYLHRSLETSIRDSKAFAIQLRMLEVFTSHNSYYSPNDPARSRKDAAMVTVYLVRNGNYRCITLGKKFMLHSSFSQTVYCTSFA